MIEALDLYEVPVVSLTSDGAKPNRRFYKLCQKPQSGCVDVPYKTPDPYRENEDIYFFCDAPHLLKTARNCFSNSYAHSNSLKMEVYVNTTFVANYTCMHNIYFPHDRRMVNPLAGNGLKVSTLQKLAALHLGFGYVTN